MSTQILMTFLVLTALHLAACHRATPSQALQPLPEVAEPVSAQATTGAAIPTDNANAPVTSTDFDIKGSIQEAPR